MRTIRCLTLVGTLIPLAALAAGTQRQFSVVADKSSLKYNVVHKLHEVAAESHAIEGKAAVLPDGKVQLMLRAPIASFKSGDGNRDEHMQETMQMQAFPNVTFKGMTTLPAPTAYPAKVQLVIDGELEFHGEKSREQVPVTVEFTSATSAHVTGGMSVSLDKYKIERPSLLFVKIEDACKIDIDLTLQGAP